MTNNDLVLKINGITQSTRIKRNLPVEGLIEDIVLNKEGKVGLNGAVMVDTGQFTGRSPLDKYILMKHPVTRIYGGVMLTEK